MSFTQANAQGLRSDSSDFVVAASPFWIACWARVLITGSATSSQAIVNRDGSGTNRAYSLLYTSTGTHRFRFGVSLNGSDLTTVNADTFGAASHDLWYFIMGYRSGTTMGVSVNGGPFDTLTIGSSPLFSSTADFRVGQLNNGGIPMGGRVDQLAFGLIPSESHANIRDFLYNAGSGRNYADLTSSQKTAFGLTSYYEMSELSGSRFDSHGINHLMPINSPGSADGVVESTASHLTPVRSWTSQVGSAAFAQDTFASRPSYQEEGSLLFDGVNDQLSRDQPLIGNRSAFTLLSRVRLESLPATNPAVVQTEADANGNVVCRLAVNASGNVVASYRPAGGTLASATSSATLAAGTEAVIGMRRNGTELQVFLGGVPSGPPATIGAGTALTGAMGRIGGPVESAGMAHLHGRVSSVFAVEQALTDAQISELSGNL